VAFTYLKVKSAKCPNLFTKDDGGGGDNWTTGAISRAKLQSNHHHQQTNIQFFYRPDALPVAHPTVSKQWRLSIKQFQSINLFVQRTWQKGPWGTDNCPKAV